MEFYKYEIPANADIHTFGMTVEKNCSVLGQKRLSFSISLQTDLLTTRAPLLLFEWYFVPRFVILWVIKDSQPLIYIAYLLIAMI